MATAVGSVGRSITHRRSSTIHVVLTLSVVFAYSTEAFATTGWDRHSVDIEGRYRIHGVNGSSVSRLNTHGNPIDPPLVDFLHPPQYIVTSTHIVLRGNAILLSNDDVASSSPGEPTQMLYVAIRKRDSMVIGPMTVDEFSTRSFDMSDALHSFTGIRQTQPAIRSIDLCASYSYSSFVGH